MAAVIAAVPYHAPIIVAGVVYDLAHLTPVTIETDSEKLQRRIVTWCRFTTHVFSRKPIAGEVGPYLMDEGRKPRVFCPDRHSLSLHLPAALSALSDPKRRVWQTAAGRNWLHKVDVAISVGSSTVDYQVFFFLKKAERSQPYDVELTVESAYAFDPLRRPKLHGRMSIVGLLTSIVEGRKPHTQNATRNR